MSAFLVYILKVALLTAVFVLLYHLLLRRDTFHRTARIVLVSSLIISYLLPFCVITIHRPAPAAVAEVASAPVGFQELPVLQQTQSHMSAQIQTQAQPQFTVSTDAVQKHVDWILVILVVYVFGTISLILLRLLSASRVRTIIRRGRVVSERDGCKIVISKDNIRPFSWMNYIVLPEGYSDHSCASAVIRHEYSHVLHHHSIELFVMDILSAFQWFNPAVWLLRHDLCCVQEFQADASVLESGYGKLEYEQSLLSIATGEISIPLVNGLGESYLRTRIRMMNRNLSGKGNLLKLIYLPVVLIVSLVLMSNTVYDMAVDTSFNLVDDVPYIVEPIAYDEPVISEEMLASDVENESTLSENQPTEADIEEMLDDDESETVQTLSAHFDDSYLTAQVSIPSYQDDGVMPQSLPDIILDSLKIQYPELNSLESIFDDDGVKTNNKAYKGYLNFIRVSNSVYEFWIAGIEEKGGKAVTIEMGSIDDAITILENLITSYKQGNTIEIGGFSFTGVKGKAYSIPRNDGSDSGPYLVSVKNLKHDLSVLEKRKKMPKVGYDEVGFFTEENKPDQYVLAGRSQSAFISKADYGVIGEKGADLMIEKMIRERAAGTTPGAWERFNGVILGPLRHSEHMGYSGERYTNYARSYIPIIYDPEKYQAPLTDYQRSLKRRVFKRK